jgi:hypothetical protein
MSLPPIDVWFEAGIEGGSPVRRLIFEGAAAPDGPRAESWWRLPDCRDLAAPPVLDSFVCSHVLWAAMLGQDLRVHGPLSPGGLHNMTEMVALRHAIAPERYRRPIAIIPDGLAAVPRPEGEPERAIAALSGGLDSTFTVVRHARRLIGDAAFELDGLVVVLGFDVPLERADRFDDLRRRLEPLARWLDLPLYTAVTNSMALGGRAWPQSAIALFGSVLASWSSRCAVGLVSGGAPHGSPRFGASHPAMLDALASNEYFRIVTDGGGFGRTDKVERLAPFPHVLAALKVCWEGPDPALNCGRCEKCVMTRLNFLAAGLPDPPCFAEPLTPAHIEALRLPSLQAARDLFRTGWAELEARGRTGPVVDLLRRRLGRVPPEETLFLAQRLCRLAPRLLPARVRHAIDWRLRV